MSNIIQLLERIGQDANLQEQEQFEQAISNAELTSELKESLLNKDAMSLERQLDICPDIVCILVPAKDDEEENEEQEDEKNDIQTVVNG